MMRRWSASSNRIAQRGRAWAAALAVLVLLFAVPALGALTPGWRNAYPWGQSPGARPTRIISLVPAATEILFAVGAGPRVVAVSSFDRDPPEVAQLPRVGALLDPNVERILSLRPDLVVVYGSQHDLVQQLDRAGIAHLSFVHGGIAETLDAIKTIGEGTGDGERASRVVVEIRQQLDDIRGRVAGRSRPRTLIVFGHEPGSLRNLYASGGYGFLHDMLEIAGGEDVFADVKRESVQASTETILARAPEVIVEIRASDETTPGLDAWQTLAAVPAVRDQRILLLQGSELVTAGPRIAVATRRLATALHPEAFK
jgi:iron complex transport system substrate-binding protein